ncbi:SSI family serine proteinase inhibitor [Streptomyces syringium]|uniref:SSI family serine proteinase inhibitor n=1 Tax=Streptomyces syringium TaxID=76729 RepID=UPI003415933C
MPRRVCSLVLAIFAMFGMSAASSEAWADAASLYPPSDLVLTFAHGDGTDPYASVDRAVTLTCMPRATGTHPDARQACRLLHEVEGSIPDLFGYPTACTKEYMPVTVTADGVWQGQRVTYEETFDNRCALLRDRGAVFDF